MPTPLQMLSNALRKAADTLAGDAASTHPVAASAVPEAAAAATEAESAPSAPVRMIDHYTKRAPDAQNTIDLFSGEWSSSFPEPFKQLDAGYAPLFEDPRIEWATSTLGGCEGQRVLELGPLESGHTWLLRRLGASSVTAIESNSRAYLRCLVVKELMQLQGTQTLYGDFLEYLRPCTEHFDLCLASGVLYHMVNPAELIGLIAKVSDRAIIWTHYYDQALLEQEPTNHYRLTEPTTGSYEGFESPLYRQNYGHSLANPAFCGSSNEFSNWMTRADILNCLRHFGLTEIEIGWEEPGHPHGPAFTVAAARPA